MKSKLNLTISALMLALLLLTNYTLAAYAQTGTTANSQATRRNGTVQPAGTNQPVTGSGTSGQIPKWAGNNGASFVLSDSVISEDKFGKVGIGTTAPTSRLTVQGMIETTLGGLKFPDGTVQMTAATSGMQSIFHDTTLIGSGTQTSPLGVAVPLVLTASVSDPLLQVTSNRPFSVAVSVKGGDSSDFNASPGTGILVWGGSQTQAFDAEGGVGIEAHGGDTVIGLGGNGVEGHGGFGSKIGGIGLVGFGAGGNNTTFIAHVGGDGVAAIGGDVSGAGNFGGVGIRAIGGSNDVGKSQAGIFEGAVEVQGSLSVSGTKNFKIDHPLDPENKYLYHAAIESSEVLNIYSGNVTTDAGGEATVTLPDWFESINRDFRYQLTVVGTFAQAIVGQKIKGNSFTIKTSAPDTEVSWQVTGVRSDAAMLKHPFKIEEDKPKSERGSYLTPDAYDKPESKGVEWARNPQLMKHLQEKKEANRQQSQPTGSN